MLVIGSPIGNGVANRILFSDENKNLAVSDNLVWDNVNARLGIGTSAPSIDLAIGDDDTGFNGSAGLVQVIINDQTFWTFSTVGLVPGSNGKPQLEYETRSLTNPIFTGKGDDDTGMGGDTDVISLITAGVSGLVVDASQRVGIGTIAPNSGLEMGNDKLFAQDVNAGLTAGTTQTQAGGLALTAQVNQISTVANTNDAAVLPVLPATGSISVTIINNGANTIRVFPGSGDDLGAGVDTADAVNIPTATARTYVSYDGTKWQKYLSE